MTIMMRRRMETTKTMMMDDGNGDIMNMTMMIMMKVMI